MADVYSEVTPAQAVTTNASSAPAPAPWPYGVLLKTQGFPDGFTVEPTNVWGADVQWTSVEFYFGLTAIAASDHFGAPDGISNKPQAGDGLKPSFTKRGLAASTTYYVVARAKKVVA